ncbi:tripartite tricarboxylate transporter TctB family protein [Halobacillus amylolyticus]|uniref:Tripartite tricarboxylate transporter TctB family protein n=1 Tax=Halobacillus amylolyticus TaxID=2932259 RepID=A0ABY4HGT8_9BACI|nr:tripartite tricarboxylate transporter TctB family protein [Halobacillus amylolyticus]UOR13964.1 tripartite tricarboxylate transporter TctB family protein [Halobacillus amylolyticus]
MQTGNLVLGTISIIFALCFFIGAQQFPEAVNKAGVGPAAFPKAISILVIIFSVTIILNSLFNKANDSRIVVKRFGNILMSVGSIIAFVVLIPILGFYISTAIFFPVLLFLASETNWKSIVMTTLIFELFAFGMFDQLLGVPLP